MFNHKKWEQESSVYGKYFRSTAFVVEVNGGADLPDLEELIGRIIVHGGVKAHIFDTDIRHTLPRSMEY